MAEEEKKPEKKKDLGKILALVFAIVNVIVVGGGTAMVYFSTLGYESPKTQEADLDAELEAFRQSLQTEPILYQMTPFKTNLDGVPRRLISVQISLEMLNEEGYEEVIDLGAETQDSIVRILNAKTVKEVETVQGKLHLKSEIIRTLNAYLERGVVRNVYFSKFAIN